MLIDDLSSLIVIIVFLVLVLLWSVLKAVFTKWCAAAKVHLCRENAKKGAPACRKCKEKYINNIWSIYQWYQLQVKTYRYGSKLRLQCLSNAVVNALTFIHLAGKLALIIINIADLICLMHWVCMPLKVKTYVSTMALLEQTRQLISK